MYDVNSKCADDFINHEEILETLAYADENKNNKTIVVVQHADSVFTRYVVFVFQGQNRKGFDEKRFDFLRRVGCACFGLSRGVQYALGLWYLFIYSLGGAVHTRHRDDYDESQNHKPCSRMVRQPCFQRLHSAKNTYDFAFTLRRSRQA